MAGWLPDNSLQGRLSGTSIRMSLQLATAEMGLQAAQSPLLPEMVRAD